MLKSAGIFAASLAAVTAAVKTTSTLHKDAAKMRDQSPDLFRMRFDGLRFIESLVTAHR